MVIFLFDVLFTKILVEQIEKVYTIIILLSRKASKKSLKELSLPVRKYAVKYLIFSSIISTLIIIKVVHWIVS